MTPLPNDICRCHNEACPNRDSCRRFVERSDFYLDDFEQVVWSEDCSAGIVPCPLYMKQLRKEST